MGGGTGLEGAGLRLKLCDAVAKAQDSRAVHLGVKPHPNSNPPGVVLLLNR